MKISSASFAVIFAALLLGFVGCATDSIGNDAGAGTDTETQTESGTETDATDFDAGECGDAGPPDDVDPDRCAALNGFCLSWWYDACPPGRELYGMWSEGGCLCCIPAPSSPCSQADESEQVHCMWESDCGEPGCFENAADEFACGPCRTCCRSLGCD